MHNNAAIFVFQSITVNAVELFMFNQTKSNACPYTSWKMMATALKKSDLLFIDFMKRGSTITADVYRDLLTTLRRVNQNQWHEKLSSCIVILHNNARPHTAAINKNIQDFFWEIVITLHTVLTLQPATTSSCTTYPMEKWLVGQCSGNNDKLMTAVVNWFKS